MKLEHRVKLELKCVRSVGCVGLHRKKGRKVRELYWGWNQLAGGWSQAGYERFWPVLRVCRLEQTMMES